MTNAEFKTRAEALGFSALSVSEANRVSKRTVLYWMNGREGDAAEIPKEAKRFIEKSEDIIMFNVARNINIIKEIALTRSALTSGYESITLIRFLTLDDFHHYRSEFIGYGWTLATHAVLLNKIRLGLLGLGFNVTMHYLQVDKYRAWLKKFSQDDNDVSMAKWAVRYYQERLKSGISI